MTSDETVSVEGEITSDTESSNKYLNNNNNNNNNCGEKNRQCDCDRNYSINQENQCAKTSNLHMESSEEIINEILCHIFDDAVKQCSRFEGKQLENFQETFDNTENVSEIDQENKKRKVLHRTTHIFLDSDSSFQEDDDTDVFDSKRDSLYSLEEHDEDPDIFEEVNKKNKIERKAAQAINNKLINRSKSDIPIRDKNAKSSIFGSVFKKKSKKDADGVDYVISDTKNSKKQFQEINPKKHSNRAFDNSSPVNIKENKTNLSRTPSLRKKLTNFLNKDAPNLLKRSFSFKDLSKRREKEKSREKLSEMKNLEWASSLQSLVETDIGISYNDLSFINYDVQNEITYKKVRMKTAPARILQRAQSLHEN
ncbi:hypothetical protein ILUMI_01642, partial [Ignelater luminosus]